MARPMALREDASENGRRWMVRAARLMAGLMMLLMMTMMAGINRKAAVLPSKEWTINGCADGVAWYDGGEFEGELDSTLREELIYVYPSRFWYGNDET